MVYQGWCVVNERLCEKGRQAFSFYLQAQDVEIPNCVTIPPLTYPQNSSPRNPPSRSEFQDAIWIFSGIYEV